MAQPEGYGAYPGFGGKGFGIIFLVILILLLFPNFWGGGSY